MPERCVEWHAVDTPAAAETLREAGLSAHLARLLARRGVESPDDAEAFLNPTLEQFHDPRLLGGLSEAVELLLRARDDGRRVALVGDYDVDGVTGTAILAAVLRHCQVDVRPILPHRLRDGYGFQPSQVERARAMGCGLILTVDCGSTSIPAVRAAIDAGLDVVVTDHHLPGAALPEGVVEINPKRERCTYPFAELCGAGLAFKLALAFGAACGKELDPLVLLRIACLGTIADLVPLQDENRAIAALGLRELEKTRSAGLRALIRVARVKAPYSTDDVGFRIGPRLNAPGRLGSAEAALELLLARDRRRADQLAEMLDGWNRERQDWERKVAGEAREHFLERRGKGELPAILVAWNEGWHRGVVGIAAGRLARDFNRPTILLAVDGASATGSGRSIAGIHLHRFLARWKDELPRFGGHSQAIGMTLTTERLAELRPLWEEAAAAAWGERVAVRRYEYELDLEPREVTWELFKELRRLAPHGEGNPLPLARVRGPLRLEGAPRVFGRGNISALAAGASGVRMKLVGWDWQEKAGVLVQGEFEALGFLEYDRYRGGCLLRLVDARPCR